MASSSPPRSDQVDVLLVGSSVDVARRSAEALLLLLRSRFGCQAQILGLDLTSAGPGIKTPMVPVKRFDTALPSGVKVSVWRADLAHFSTAAAVVNAANSRLQHYGGLALALSEAGGPQVQDDSDRHVHKHGEVKTGDAVALDAGNLPCKTIIHAVGPQLPFRPNVHEVSAARKLLERTVRSVLDIVEKKQLESVAIPAISSGIFHFPVDECADAIVTTVRAFYGSSSSHRFKPREVLLVNNDDPTVKEMERACMKLLLKPAPVSYSQAAAAGVQTTGPVQTRGAKSKESPPEVQLGLVRLLLRKGRLEEQKMEVIVNTASSDRNLSVGRVSNALLMKAGRKMQEEIKQAFSYKSILITGSYNLQCRQVYHTFCPDRAKEGAHQVLFRSVQDCLECAVTASHRSIAFPAIGTGALGFRKHEAAQVMVTAVNDFSHRCLVPFEVHFVIFQNDSDVFKVFEEELQSLRAQVEQSHHGFTGAAPSPTNKPALLSSQEQGRVEEVERSVPCIRLESPSQRSRVEAEAWLQGLLYNQSNSIRISNNYTQLLEERHLEELSRIQVEVQVEEFLEKGRSGLVVFGERVEDVAVVAVKLQEVLQEVQEQYQKEEVKQLKVEAQSRVEVDRSPVSNSDPQLRPVLSQLKTHGLKIDQVEKVENLALEKLFKLQMKHMSIYTTSLLLQLVPAPFCDLVCHVGLRPECAPPDDPCLGEGLYLAADLETALNLWTERSDHFLYLIVAEVLKGRSGRGRPGLVLAPGQDSGPGPESRTRYDCVEESGVTVVFDHRQVLPRFILSCSRHQGSYI